MGDKVMRIKTKPKKPKHKIIKIRCEFEVYGSVQKLIDDIREMDPVVSLDQVVMCKEGGWYGDAPDHHLEWSRPETENEYAARWEIYHQKLKKYNAWYEKNKGKIKAELENRKQKKEAEKAAKVEELKKQLAKLEEELTSAG